MTPLWNGFFDEMKKIAGVMDDAGADYQRMLRQHASNPTFRKAMTQTGNPRQALDFYKANSNPAVTRSVAAANQSVKPGNFKGLVDTSKKFMGAIPKMAPKMAPRIGL